MNKPLKDALAKGVHKVIMRSVSRGGAIDPIGLAEDILDNVELLVDMAYEDSGIGSMPGGMAGQAAVAGELAQEGPVWDVRANAPSADPERPHFLAPPQTSKAITAVPPGAAGRASVLVMPGDPDFNKALPGDTVRPGAVRASMKRTRPGANRGPAKQFWDEGDLIDAIIKNTPEDIAFDMRRLDGTPFRIVAKRNVLNMPGIGASLTYLDPRGGNAVPPAKHPFSIFDEEIDIQKGIESISKQLAGIYVDRSGGAPSPVAVGPEPNLHDYMRTGIPGGTVGISIDRDDNGRARNVSSQPLNAPKDQDSILQSILDSARRSNNSMVPKESQLRNR